MDELELYQEKMFDDIKHVDELEREYWQNFEKIILKAKIACDNSNNKVLDHFIEVSKMVKIGLGAKRKKQDFKLT